MSLLSGIFKRSTSGGPRTLPATQEGAFDDAKAAEYADFVGATGLTHTPPMAFHNLCFPTTARVLGEPAVPARLFGLVHESLTWEIIEPLPVGVPATASSLITRTNRQRGLSIEVASVVAVGETVHYVERAVYYSRKPLRGPAYDFDHIGVPPDWDGPEIPDLRGQFGTNDVGALDIEQRVATATRHLTPDTGRRWAKISGDVNPIHMSNASARPFGFKSAIAHGAAIEAWAHASLGVNGTAPCSGAAKFRAPTKIPNEIELVPFGDGLYGVVEARSGRDLVHLRINAGRVGAAEVPPTRIVIPRHNGRASSTALGQATFTAAAEGDAIQRAVVSARNWRKDYREPVRQVAILDDPAHGPNAAQRALTYLEGNVTTADGTPVGRIEAGVNVPLGLRVVGQGSPRQGLAIPHHGALLEGVALDEQLTRWTANGTMTAVAAERLREVAANPQWLALSDTTIGILGAGAELAPTRFLLDYGATVAGVIRPDSSRHSALVSDARTLAGTLDLSPAEASDITEQTGAIAGWMLGRNPDVVVETLYAPGADFVLLELGADAIMRNVAAESDALLAWYGTPTDAHPIGAHRERAGGIARRQRPRRFPLGLLQGTPAIRDGIFNGIVDYQGPNYILAKRIGRWRATALAAQGKRVSFNIAPMAETESVLVSKTLVAAYRGMEKLGLEPVGADTAAAIMATLLVWDLRNPHTANADFLTEAAVPSGLWSQDSEPQDLMKRAVLLGSGAFIR